jgi:hypothetical protein
MTTLAGFPTCLKRSAEALIAGLQRIAETVVINSTARTSVGLPQTKRLPRCFPWLPGPQARSYNSRLMPGTTLIREWDRHEYRVTVTSDGLYELGGKRYKSLSATAKAITGTHWSGPAFFGLKGHA